MASRLKIGLVGAGDIGRIHAQAYQRLGDVDLIVAKGRDPQKAASLANDMGATVAANYEALLADDSIDAIDLCIPNDLHHQYARAAARVGKPTLCEKPIAMSLAEGEEMIEAFDKAGAPLMVAHVLRFWPEYAEARDLIARGELGRIHTLSARRMLSLLKAVQGAEGWRRDANRMGGAAIDLQIHDIDYALWLFGLPATVFSRGVRSEYGSFDHVYTLLGYDDGLTVGIESSYMLKGNPVVMDFRAVGEKASLEFSFIATDFAMHDMHTDAAGAPSRRPPSLLRYEWGRDAQALCEQSDDPIAAAFDNQARAFTGLVRSDAAVQVPAASEALDALRVAIASLESCETGRPVEIATADAAVRAIR